MHCYEFFLNYILTRPECYDTRPSCYSIPLSTYLIVEFILEARPSDLSFEGIRPSCRDLVHRHRVNMVAK